MEDRNKPEAFIVASAVDYWATLVPRTQMTQQRRRRRVAVGWFTLPLCLCQCLCLRREPWPTSNPTRRHRPQASSQLDPCISFSTGDRTYRPALSALLCQYVLSQRRSHASIFFRRFQGYPLHIRQSANKMFKCHKTPPKRDLLFYMTKPFGFHVLAASL